MTNLLNAFLLLEEPVLETIQRDSVISCPGLGIFGLNPPAFFSVFGHRIYFYGVLFALGFLLGILYCAKRSPDFGIKTDDYYDAIILLIPLSILCARAGGALEGAEAVRKSFPDYWDRLRSLGLEVEIQNP